MTSRAYLIVAGLGILLGGCQVRDDDPYAVRERELEARVDRLDQVFNKNQSLQGISQRIDEQQQQIQQLRGEVEVLEHDSELDKKQQRDLYQDLDKRLQHIEMGLSGNASAPSAGTEAAPAASTAAAAPAGSAEEAAYQKSFNLLKQGRFNDSIKGFKSFVKLYPKSSLASNAAFWTGEAYYQMSDFDTALATFRKVLKDYPQSNKLPDATLKVGLCQYELQQWQSARQTLTSVVQNYPNTTAASQASQRLQRMQDEGH